VGAVTITAMTTLERLGQWKLDGVITEPQHERLRALVRSDRFSVSLELNALLYLGVLAIAAGVAWTVQTHFASLGDAAIVLALTAIVGACFWYCFSRARPYSSDEVESPTLMFDYVLYLGCVVFAIELGYLETRFTLLGNAWDAYVLLSAVVFFGAAYRFDNRFVLSLALSTLAAWFGIKLNRLGIQSADSLRISALTYGVLVAGAGAWLHQLAVKRHFLETHLHVAATAVFIALVSGAQSEEKSLLYLVGLIVLGAISINGGIRCSQFAFVAYGVAYPYLGISIRLTHSMNSRTLAFGYWAVSGSAMAVLVVYLARRFGREE
jgi:predicted membrane protein DUF2157